MGETEAVSRASGWRWPASEPQGARAERGIRPEPLSLGGLICEVGRSRTWNPSRLAVEPSLPARVEKGAWRGARLAAVPADGSPPSGCRLLATPGIGTRAGDLGSGPEKRRRRHPARAGARLGEPVGREGARGVASTTPPRSRRGQSYPALLPLLPSPPASSSAAPAHLAAGRGAPRLGSPGRLSRMLRGREPCSCHGCSSLYCRPPLHQALKTGIGPAHRSRPPSLSVSLSGESFGSPFWPLAALSGEKMLILSLGSVLSRTCLIGTSASWGSGFSPNLLVGVWDGHLKTALLLLPPSPHIPAAGRVGCSRGADTPPPLLVSASSWSGLRLAWSLLPPKKLLPARVLPAQDPEALAVLAHLGAWLGSPGARRGRRPPLEPRSRARGAPPVGHPAWPWLGLPRKRWPDRRGFKGSLRRCGRGAPAPGRVPRKPGGVGLGPQWPGLTLLALLLRGQLEKLRPGAGL